MKQYFTQFEIPLAPEPVWTEKASHLAAGLQQAITLLEEDQRQRVVNDADRIAAIADDIGQTAIFAVTQNAETLEALPNGIARAVWMLLHSPIELDHAEEVRFADDRRLGRMWDGFICEPQCLPTPADNHMVAFKEAIRKHFDGRNVEVEHYSRTRARLDKKPANLLQAAIYREGRPGERKAFVDGELDRLLYRPVIEAAITYESDTGIVEVVANAKDTREALVRLFAEHLLSKPFQGKRIPIRQYQLARLLEPFDFPTDPVDEIEGVKVTLLRLMPFDTATERVTLECMRGAQLNIWQMAHIRFAEHSPLNDGYSVTQARFTIKFRSRPGTRGSRTFPVTVTMPRGCDLKDRIEREQLIGEKYLRRWGLLRDV